MSIGNIAFLGLVIGSFATFALVLGWASANYTRWKHHADPNSHTNDFTATPQMSD